MTNIIFLIQYDRGEKLPNIELHGFGSDSLELRAEIIRTLDKKDYVNDMVVSICLDVVVDKNGNEQPYIRVISDCIEHIKDISKELKKFNAYMEHLLLIKV